MEPTILVTAAGEGVERLVAFLRGLDGAPQVHEVVVLACHAHGEQPATWAYVEADAVAGVARCRCLACGAVTVLLDSERHWTYPPMHSCRDCGQSIVEVAVGLSVPDGVHVRWLAVGAQCVTCGAVAGVADVVVDDLPVEELPGRLWSPTA